MTQKAGQNLLANAGFHQYEISAYSQPGWQCRHNVNYWQFGDYLGIGAGAHGKISLALPGQIIRTQKPKSPEHYLRGNYLDSEAAPIDFCDVPLEFVMNHLRLRAGFTLAHYQTMTGLDDNSLEPALSECQMQGLLEKKDEKYTCTEKGWDFLDSILQQFLAR
jgi:oxygen-independent coproporphyrinogen-3 oxidase